jgi:expansin (peptidoglycan-binding protein)
MRGPGPLPRALIAPALALLVAACSGDGPPRGGAPLACAADAWTHAGEATYYPTANGDGACMLGPATDPMIGAINAVDWAGSAACGGCVAVTGPAGSIAIRIVDLCPECPRGDIDLGPEAFAKIAPLAAGRVPIAWRWISCDDAGPIRYRFKDGSNPYWLAVQVRDHVNRIARVEARAGGAWVDLARADYNHFVAPAGLGAGPFAFRVTDVHGNAVEDAGVPLVHAAEAPGAGQFPVCGAP